MYYRFFKIRLKCLIRDYDILFRSFAFPILLSLFFYFGFYNLSQGEEIATIPIAVVENTNSSNDLIQIMESARIDENTPLFQMKRVTRAKAESLLRNKDIEGIIINTEEPELMVNASGYDQTIIKSFLDDYLQSMQTIKQAGNLNKQLSQEDLLKVLTSNKNYIIDGSTGSGPDNTLIYFYTLIALACMFGSSYGFRDMRDIQANQSSVAARLAVAPVHKLKLLLCNLAASFTLHFFSVLLLLIFLNKVLMINFGGEALRMIAICLLGSLCGIAFGAMVCVSVKANIKVRSAIMYIVVLGGGFLSGMVIVDMKYIISKNIPILGYLNPSNLITDAFYSLYFYDGYDRYQLNLFLLVLLTGIFTAVTYFEVRRRDYASI